MPGTTHFKGTVDAGVAFSVAGSAITATPTEVNKLAGVTAGTVTASKAVVVDSNKRIDTIVVADGGLKLGSGAGTAVDATATEINARCDDSAMEETRTGAGACSVTVAVTKVDTTGGAAAITLAAPSKPAMIKVIKMTVDAGDATMALTNVVGGSAATTATFNDVDDTLILISDVASGKWVVIKELGVVLS